jgi:hypothetical protein
VPRLSHLLGVDVVMEFRDDQAADSLTLRTDQGFDDVVDELDKGLGTGKVGAMGFVGFVINAPLLAELGPAQGGGLDVQRDQQFLRQGSYRSNVWRANHLFWRVAVAHHSRLRRTNVGLPAH